MRPADEIFLRLAVERGCLGAEDARDVQSELERLERAGQPTKARLLCIELGFIGKDLARTIKREVREVLGRQAGADDSQAAPVRRPSDLGKKRPTPANDATRSVQPVATRDEQLDPFLMESVEIGSAGQRRIAGFELMEPLGQGAMGEVWKAKHLGLQEVVALKLMNREFASDAKYVARFTQEAQVAFRLNHPNIVRAFDVGQTGNVHYLAMEFVEGKTVKELVDRRGQLEEAAAVEIVLQILDALAYAHGSNLVHRDIKPANLMIMRDGQAKLLDLGLAKRTDVENGLTAEGRAIGTPYYMAPEAALDRGADYRTDIYSLGVTLFNMVTGTKPYEAGTPVAVMNMHLKAPIPDARERNPRISEGLARIIKKMMAKRPADRYQDHTLLAQDLESVLRGLMPELKGGQAPEGIEYIKARPTATAKAGRRGEASSRAPMLVGAAAALLVVGAAAFVLGAAGSRTTTVSTAAGVEAEAPTGSEDEGRARSALAEAPGLRGRARADELLHVAKQFPATESGQRARKEADGILAELAAEERGRFEGRKAEIDGIALRGDLHEARLEYEGLARTVDDEQLKAQALDRADELAQEITRRLSEAEAEVARLIAAGDEPGAARVLRGSAPLRAGEEREGLEARLEELKARHAARKAEVAAQAKTQAETQARAREEQVVGLPARLQELVRAEKASEALALARKTGGEVADLAPAAQRVARHASALEAIVGLTALADSAFARLQGQQVQLERRQGREVKGRLVAAVEGRLSVAVSQNVEVTVSLAELAEVELWRAIRKVHGAAHPPFLHGLAALKLYRGDGDAAEAVEKARGAGIDLTALQDDLREVAAAEPLQALVAEGAATPVASDPNEAVRKRNDEERARFEKYRRWAEGRQKLFQDLEALGFVEGEFQLAWVFQGRRTFNRDWTLAAGRAFPTPAGQEFRDGLVLEGRGGRAELGAPLVGDVTVKVRFEPQMVSSSEGRFAITLDDSHGGRVSADLGQLLLFKKRKPVGSAGERAIGRLRAKELHVLELVRRGDQVATILDGAELARLPLDPSLMQGSLKLGLEWSHAALNLLTIEVQAPLEEGWIEKRIAGSNK